jgi:hypothetical protein
MLKSFTAGLGALTITLLPSLATAQGDIPQEVIDECNATARATDLPHCLKTGALAYEMLEVARSDAAYGDAAETVLTFCEEENSTFQDRWVCFDYSAKRAAETHELIGRDNISDDCVAAISDPDIYAELEKTFDTKLGERFPGEYYVSMGRNFTAFPGCKNTDNAETHSDTSDKVADALAAALAPQNLGNSQGASNTPASDTPAHLRAEACTIYAEMKEIVASNSPDELRDMAARAKALDDPSPVDTAEIFGLSADAAEFLDSLEGPGQGFFAPLLGSFLHEHHPQLLVEFLDSNDTPGGGPASELGGQMARGFVMKIIENTRGIYDTSC